MNFYGHLAMGYRSCQDPEFLLGTMLPDFAGMAGLRRLRAPGLARVTAGIAHHHETDAVFHRTPLFSTMVASGIEDLEAVGLGRGAARAVAHVGVELLLDGLILKAPDGPGLSPYRAALDAAVSARVLAHVRADGDATESRFQGLIERLAEAPIPERYVEPRFVAERLAHILAPRPRLALSPGGIEPVTTWLAATRTRLADRYPTFLGQIVAGLSQG